MVHVVKWSITWFDDTHQVNKQRTFKRPFLLNRGTSMRTLYTCSNVWRKHLNSWEKWKTIREFPTMPVILFIMYIWMWRIQSRWTRHVNDGIIKLEINVRWKINVVIISLGIMRNWMMKMNNYEVVESPTILFYNKHKMHCKTSNKSWINSVLWMQWS